MLLKTIEEDEEITSAVCYAGAISSRRAPTWALLSATAARPRRPVLAIVRSDTNKAS